MKKNILYILIVQLCFVHSGCRHNVYEIDMVHIPGGDFLMGSVDSDADPDEAPVHPVYVNDFYIGKYEVTQRQWKAVMSHDPAYHRGLDYPVECVSWEDCQKFIRKLNAITGLTYRLPTEEEWEYVASISYKNMDKRNITSYAWCLKSVEKLSRTNIISHEVGSLKPDVWGIYDIIGNVNEWCSNSYDSLSYQKGFSSESDEKVFRGGCFGNVDKFLKPTNRNHADKYTRHYSFGFRLARDITPECCAQI